MTDREKVAKLYVALQTLIVKMDEVHASPEYRGVWTLYHVHGGEYEGPNYVKEIETAKKALWDVKLPGFEEPKNTSE